jgi:hypothetical protein
MFQGLISPQAALKSNFGEALETSALSIIVRSWTTLIGLMGIMLIYGAFVSTVRRYSLIIVGISKIVFIFLILSLGRQYLDFGAGTAVIIDSIMVVLFIIYLLLSRNYTST